MVTDSGNETMAVTDRDGEQDASMEEILSSIRKIISDGGEAGEGLTPDPAGVVSAVAPPAAPDIDGLPEPPPPPPDVLASVNGPSADDAPDAAYAEPPLEPELPDRTEIPPALDGLVSEPALDKLVSEEAEAASVNALTGLGAVAALPPEPGAAGGRTVEQFTADLIKPMLREWLDANLPDMVRTIVEAEVRRLAERLRR